MSTWIVTRTEQFHVRAESADAAILAVEESLAHPVNDDPDVDWMQCTETNAEEMVPVEGAEDITADPGSAALLARRLANGEITPDELRDTLAGKYNAREDA